MTEIVLPWPPRELHPNSRVDRRAATAKRKAAREAGFWAVKAAGVLIPPDAELCLTFHPPDNRRRDVDGMFSACKAMLDGMALAAGVDDAGWSFRLRKGPPIPGGEVRVVITPPLDTPPRLRQYPPAS